MACADVPLSAILPGMNYLRTTTGLLCAFLVSWLASAQVDAPALGEAALHQAILDLSTDMRLMCVAAHPDDEDGATLARYRMKYGVRTAAVLATRGEGGQNEIGPELYEDLAVIRTDEMMRAAAITGAQPLFLNLPDFGYSKTPEETFDTWGRQDTLRQLVRAIRGFRPDVIITHHGKAKDHGHHQALGAALLDAFDAAADPAMFPEQAESGLEPWQVTRLYVRTWNKTPGAVAVPIAELEPVRGRTYAELAAAALRAHASQGMGFFIDRLLQGPGEAYYELVKEAVPLAQPQPGSAAAPGELLAGLDDRVSEEIRNFCSEAVENPAERKRLLFEQLARNEEYDAELHRAAAIALQMRLDVEIADETVVPGQELYVRPVLTDFGGHDADEVTFSLSGAWGGAAQQTQQTDNGPWAGEFVVQVPSGAAHTLPRAAYVFDEGHFTPQITVAAEAVCAGQPVRLNVPVHLDVAPPVAVDYVDAPYLIRLGTDKTVTFLVRLTNYSTGVQEGNLILSASSGLKLGERRIPFKLDAGNGQTVIPVTAGVHDNILPGDLHLNTMLEGKTQSHLAVARGIGLSVPGDVSVGVVQSYDDTFVESLRRLAVPHRTLEIKDLTPDRLDGFDVIIVDIRAYLVRPDLAANNRALLDYVARGGRLIVNYQKTYEWKPEYAPYPIELSRNRVTLEDAPISLLEPGHPFFNTPNAIQSHDWDGWAHERGLYFPAEWDERYTPLVACNDPGEEVPPGALLFAEHGEGDYVYTALSLYRQLRDLHPGALRLFANMLAVSPQS